jgi:hypothetical protein
MVVDVVVEMDDIEAHFEMARDKLTTMSIARGKVRAKQ